MPKQPPETNTFSRMTARLRADADMLIRASRKAVAESRQRIESAGPRETRPRDEQSKDNELKNEN